MARYSCLTRDDFLHFLSFIYLFLIINMLIQYRRLRQVSRMKNMADEGDDDLAASATVVISALKNMDFYHLQSA